MTEHVVVLHIDRYFDRRCLYIVLVDQYTEGMTANLSCIVFSIGVRCLCDFDMSHSYQSLNFTSVNAFIDGHCECCPSTLPWACK